MRFLVAACLFLLLAPLGAAARMLGDPGVSFTADRDLVIGDRSYPGKIYSIPGAQRHEQAIEGIQQIVILRKEQQRGWLLLPVINAYIEFGIGPIEAELDDDALLSTRVGEETIQGMRTTKYRIEKTARNGSLVDGWAWLTREGIPMRLDGTYTPPNGGAPTRVHMELSNVELRPLDRELFNQPRNMMKLPFAELSRLLGFGRNGS